MFSLTIKTVQMGRNWVAITQLSGITIRGQVANDEQTAVENLLYVLAESKLAIGLALSGQTMSELLERIGVE